MREINDRLAERLPTEETQKDNSPTHTDVIFDSAFVTNGGFNYKHINSTLAGNTSVQPGKIGIAHDSYR